MDQSEIGKFISKCRKEKKLTQAMLAEKLSISDRAVSKWETGRSMPDASIMMELCEVLGITVNDLFNARRINMDNYKEIAEKTMLEMREREEQTSRQLLALEWVIAVMAVAVLVASILLADMVSMPLWLKVLDIGIGIMCFAVGMYFAMKIETEAGYYECPKCKKRYVPNFYIALFAMHFGRTRLMKCPHCGKRGWHKKVLTRSADELTIE